MRQFCSLLIVVFISLFGCSSETDSSGGSEAERTVVVYTALDQIYSEPILKQFTEKTGIKVLPVYDSEASKTVGLVNRIIAEKDRPRCDVFWNNEIIRTLHLKREGVLEAYASPSAEGLPEAFKDSEGYWTGFAARARVIVYNTELISADETPRSMADLLAPQWKGKVGMAYPLFGTTSTHAAVLFQEWGRGRAENYYHSLNENGVVIVDGNMTACRSVAEGHLSVAFTDTDDAYLLQSQGKPIDFALLDHDGDGALLIPNTVALIKDSPNPDAGKALIDYLLSAEVESALAYAPSIQIPLRGGVDAPPVVREMAEAKFWEVDFAAAAEQIEPSAEFLKKTFSSP